MPMGVEAFLAFSAKIGLKSAKNVVFYIPFCANHTLLATPQKRGGGHGTMPPP